MYSIKDNKWLYFIELLANIASVLIFPGYNRQYRDAKRNTLLVELEWGDHTIKFKNTVDM